MILFKLGLVVVLVWTFESHIKYKYLLFVESPKTFVSERFLLRDFRPCVSS
jgi:hypothetical protein